MKEFIGEDEDLLLPEEVESDPESESEPEPDPEPDAENEPGEELDEGEDEDEDDEEEDEESVPVEDSTPAPVWVKRLRKNYRELLKHNRQLEAQVNVTKEAEQKPLPLGKKPTLDEHDYDTDKYEEELDKWYVQKQKVDERERSERAEAEKANQKWQTTLTAYNTAKASLEVNDFEEAEEVAASLLSITQQGIILKGSKKPELVIYELGRNVKKARLLAAIEDPIEFAFAISDLEKDLKSTKRKSSPAPEKTVRGNAAVSGTVNSQLERLRAEAEKTGNYTKVAAYKAQLKAKGK